MYQTLWNIFKVGPELILTLGGREHIPEGKDTPRTSRRTGPSKENGKKKNKTNKKKKWTKKEEK